MTPCRCPSCGHTHAAPADALLAALPRAVRAILTRHADSDSSALYWELRALLVGEPQP